MTNEIFENETTNTTLTVDQRNNRFLAIPEDPKELDTFVTIGTKAIEAAQAILKKQRISGEEWRQLHEKTKEQGYIVLEAANKLAIAVREIPTTSGGRPKKGSLDEADLSDETISSSETVFSEETISNEETVHDEAIRAKKQVLEEDFGLTEKQAWKIAKLTVEAVDKEKAYAKDNDEVPLLKHAISFVESGERKLAKAKKDHEILKSRNRTEKAILPDGKFDIIYADIGTAPEIAKIADKITDTAILYLWADANQLPEALEFMKSLSFEHQNCAAYIKNQTQTGLKYIQTKHRLILVGVKGEYPTPYSWRMDSVFYENDLVGCSEVEYFGSQIEMMYPDGAYLDLISEKVINDKWSVCNTEEEV